MSADKVAFDANTGTLNIGAMFSGDLSGMYQCVVSNDYGTAMTPYLEIVQAGMCVCVRACVLACVHVYVRACMCVCVCTWRPISDVTVTLLIH